MTIGPEQRNAEMRGEPYESASERRAKNYHAENIDLRGQLGMARKATSAAQELLEAERAKVAKLETDLIDQKEARAENASSALESIRRVKELRLLRVNDAATIADLERRLREAEGQLKAQREAARGPFGDPVWDSKGVSQWVRTDWANAKIEWYSRQRTRLAAENAELHRTISLMAKTAAEVQDNFRLIAELAADPADEKRKETKP